MDNIKYGNNIDSENILKLLNDYQLLEVFSGLKMVFIVILVSKEMNYLVDAESCYFIENNIES